MKTSQKLLSLALAMGMFAAVATGCADETWSYKDDQNTLSIGTYIYYMSGGYGYASNQVSSANSSSSSSDVDILSQKIKDQDDKEINAKDYILREADKACKNLLNTEKIFAERKLKLTETELTSAKTNSDTAWGYYGKTYEGMGISKDSFYNAEYLFGAKYDAIFKSIYGIGGEKAVSDKEIKDYFIKNYTDYSYLPMNLYTSTTDQSSATGGTTAVKLSDDEIKKAKKDFDEYAKLINNGKSTYKKATEDYTKEYGLEKNPSVADTQVLDSSSLGEELIKALKDLDEGKATVIEVGKDTTAVLYLVYKGDINESAKNVFSETQRNKVLHSVKFEEFQKDMDKQAESYKCEKNDAAVNKYQPSMFNDIK